MENLLDIGVGVARICLKLPRSSPGVHAPMSKGICWTR